MDWDLKTPCWDFAEFERETEPNNRIPFTGLTSFAVGEQKKKKKKKKSNRGRGGGGDCSVALKLGRFGDFGGENSMNMWKETMVSSPLTTLKRGRASNNGNQSTVSCLVDGCDADLSKCRDYHRRHKVCEVHSKTPKVSVGGQEQRFCQQCSRFHLLVEFDEAKRSCRKRLDGHNRRRRKPQPEPLSMNSESLFPYQGSRFLPYSSPPQIFPSTAVASSAWPAGIMKTEEDTTVNTHHLSLHSADRQSSFSVSFSRNQKGGKQFPFLQLNEFGDRTTVSEGSVCQPLLNTIASSESAGTGGKMFSRALDSDCALSLLSSPPTRHSGISLSHVLQQQQQQQQQPDSIPMSQPLFPGLQYNNGVSRYNSQRMDGGTPMASSVLVSDDTTDAELSCQGIFHLGPNGSSQNGMPQALPFSWQ